MNDENLEQQLRNLPASELPEAWRVSILATALREARVASQPRRSWPPLLLYMRNICARNPVTAGAMATLWMLIFFLKINTPIDSTSSMMLAHVDPNHPIYLTSISEEIRLVQLLQETSQPEPRQIP